MQLILLINTDEKCIIVFRRKMKWWFKNANFFAWEGDRMTSVGFSFLCEMIMMYSWFIAKFIHSFIHYGDLYSAPSRLLLRSAPDPCTAKKKSSICCVLSTMFSSKNKTKIQYNTQEWCIVSDLKLIPMYLTSPQRRIGHYAIWAMPGGPVWSLLTYNE